MSTDLAGVGMHSNVPSPRRAPEAGPAGEAVRGRNVLVVGINYAPEPTGIAPYTTGMAEYLAEHAAAVEVLTGLPSYPSWTVPSRYRRGLRFTENHHGVRVRRLKHVVPSRQDALRRGAYELSFLAHTVSVRPTRMPHVVIGVTPALGGAVAAARLAQRHQARLVLVVQDLLGKAAVESGISGGGQVAGLVQRWERWALRRADAVAVVAEAFGPSIEAYGVRADRISLVPNWSHARPSTADRAATRAALGWGAGVRVALHSGNMGLKQDLGNVIEAARLTRDRPDLIWVLMGDGSQRTALIHLSRGLPNVRFLPLCDGDRYPDILAAADVLLLNERAGVAEMSLPSKLTGYFLSGRPVASAVSAGGSTARELARAGAPAPTEPGDAAALAQQVLALCADPERGARHGATAARYARENLSFSTAARRFDAVLASVLRAGGTC